MALIDRIRAAVSGFNNPNKASGNLPQYFASCVGTVVTWQGQNVQNLVRDGYVGNDIVYSIVSLITSKAQIAPFDEYEIINEQEYKKYKALLNNKHLIQDTKQLIELQHKALEPVKNKSKLGQLLEEPNKWQSFSDFLEEWAMFKLITGNAFTYLKLIEAGNNKGLPNSMHNLPSQYMQIIADTTVFPIEPVGYELFVGYTQNFSIEEILHDKYSNPSWDSVGQELYGLSPITAAYRTITRSNEAKTASVSTFQNGGPPGVLFMDDERYTADQLAAQAQLIKNKLNNYKGSKNAGDFPVSPYKVGWTATGLSPVDLAIIESEKWDLRQLCAVYGVPPQLLGATEGSTYNNLREAEKALTVRAAIPLLTSLRDSMNRKFKGSIKGRVIDFDLTVYPELEATRAEQVGWLKDAWWLPIKRKYEILGEPIPDDIPEDELNQILVPSNLVPLEQLGLNEPLP